MTVNASTYGQFEKYGLALSCFYFSALQGFGPPKFNELPGAQPVKAMSCVRYIFLVGESGVKRTT